MNDIAMIKLSEKVSSEIKPAVISTIQHTNLFGLNAVAVGWGQTINNTTPAMLHVANLLILPNEECSRRATNLSGDEIIFDKRMVCTGYVPYAILHDGDSGGPLLFRNQILAVSSGTCPFPQIYVHPEKLNVHFSVNFYKKFIRLNKL
ncbi:PREDICTED: kallikrein-7-like [Ceratosolen solmsi marchali]|uniref:Kallikrein-7-like n=1 Tax=Ceratosolen solmsi marchali TaxID=326594 RepID=A0AAJ6YNQ3_9HYME|nr:PREDICTED: kallikrein-7-like [Ceratosolen solmsi marchali]